MSWKNGLVHIWCTECGHDLGWTSQAFVDRHPMSRCWNCRDVRRAVYGPAEGRRELAGAEALRLGHRVLAAIRRWTA